MKKIILSIFALIGTLTFVIVANSNVGVPPKSVNNIIDMVEEL